MSGFEQDPHEMTLGDHLDELRSRVIRCILVFFVLFIVGFVYQKELKEIFEAPFFVAIEIAGEELCASIGLDKDGARFQALGLQEPVMNSIKVAFVSAIALAFPVLVWQVWGFVVPALHRNERYAGFLFVPLAVIFFYTGVIVGYYWGLPYLYYLLFEWAASSGTADLNIRESEYLSFFMVMTMSFGIVMNIPWFVMVLVYARLVKPEQLSAWRQYVYFGAVVLAAMLSPPDIMSQIALFIPMVILFEIGLLASRIMVRKREEAIAQRQEP